MCGIAGFNWNDKKLIKSMTDSICHRGPDDEGFYTDCNVCLGHRRLAIVDTSSNGHQPMRFKNFVIVYNGELYNFKELRRQLKTRGYRFFSNTDTEVVLYSYIEWGANCLNRFNGMWSFCIYDKGKNIFFLSRDRFGIKPLYYYFDGDKFIFASELKAIRRHRLNLEINIHALNFFFYQKYIGSDLTIFKNIYKLKPSENIIFNLKTSRIMHFQYYDLKEKISEYFVNPVKDRVDLVEDIIVSAVEKRLIADVPVGSFLSGGVDSSLISAIISKKHNDFDTFSVGFKDESYDELKYSKLVSEHIGTSHHYDYMDINEDIIRFVLNNMDEPFGDASLLPTYLLSKVARRKITVSLSGDAADEIFFGYDTYKAHNIARCLPHSFIWFLKYLVDHFPVDDEKVTLPFKIKRFVRDFHSGAGGRHLDWMATFSDSQRAKLLNDNFMKAESIVEFNCNNSFLSVQLNDIQNYLAEDILKKVDTASMLNSLEVRVPFLDHRLVPLVLSLPEGYKIRWFKTKWLLKKIALRYLPKKIIFRPKRGFTVPISSWIKRSDFLQKFLTDSQYYSHNLLNYDYVQYLFSTHICGGADNSRQLWLIFIFNYWWYNERTKKYSF